VEVQGVFIDIRTLHFSGDYKKSHKNYRTKFLEDWEKRHKENLANLLKKKNVFEDIIMNRLLPFKLELKDVKIIITDTITSHSVKKIALNINSVTSYGCDDKWEQQATQKADDNVIRRLFKIHKMYISIYKEKYVRDEEAEASKIIVYLFFL
jgi:hypothetical protein